VTLDLASAGQCNTGVLGAFAIKVHVDNRLLLGPEGETSHVQWLDIAVGLVKSVFLAAIFALLIWLPTHVRSFTCVANLVAGGANTSKIAPEE